MTGSGLSWHRTHDKDDPPDIHSTNDDRIDEGFSETPHESTSAVMIDAMEMELPDDVASSVASVRDWLLSQPPGLRYEFTRMMLASLPTSLQAPIVREAEARLYFDPTLYFPPEILLQIFQYLDVHDVITASYVSKHWRLRAQEPLLWRRLFVLQGWTYNKVTLRAFERSCHDQMNRLRSIRTVKNNQSSTVSDSVNNAPSLLQAGLSKVDSRVWVKDACLTFKHNAPTPSDCRAIPAKASSGSVDRCSEDDVQMVDCCSDLDSCDSASGAGSRQEQIISTSAFCPVIQPPRILEAASSSPQLNWPYIFAQRQRLERNWLQGKFTPFRIPKEGYESEQHKECIYSLQFSSKHVASGSRDRTIRVWDLDTQRLKMPPLVGHRGSVLCLQFDESREQDVMISGGSDASVIIWRFSTGEKIKHIQKAHSESVLNLRFDNRYLVTCSKDNSIKVWNRHTLSTSDSAYPATNVSRDARYPNYIISLADLTSDIGARLPPPLPLYSELMSLKGHTAAVNALSLYNDRIASASGDRKIILWDISTGTIMRIFSGHTKGIACVQYDGKRIISGSSDKTVRIFDAETGAEVSLLEGHCDLVRTVQADFGEVAGDEVELHARAQAHGEAMLDRKRKRLYGEIMTPPAEDSYIVGAKLPPGAGGKRWSKIVSGSYDESVIIWRQQAQGQWISETVLKHEDAMNATISSHGQQRQASDEVANQATSTSSQGARSPADVVAQLQREVNRARNLQTAHAWMAAPQLSRVVGSQTRILPTPNPLSPHQWATGFGARRQSAGSPPNGLLGGSQAISPLSLSGRPPPPQTLLNPHGRDNRPGPATPVFPARTPSAPGAGLDPSNSTSTSAPHSLSARHLPHHAHSIAQPLQSFQQPPFATAMSQPLPIPSPTNNSVAGHGFAPAQAQPLGSMPQSPPPQQQSAPQAAVPPALVQPAAADPHGPDANPSRLFKLQFDARRIVCCSQQPVIVGWDFAAGDRDIAEASQFFGETV